MYKYVSLTIPVAMGYIPAGMLFGLLFQECGGSGLAAMAASIFIYAGSAQYLMIPLLKEGLPLFSISLAIAALNLRHIFYGFSLWHRFPTRGWQRWYMVYALTDESYSLLTTMPLDTPHKSMLMVAALNHLWWVLGTAIGLLLGSQISLSLQGLDFVMVSMFAVLAVEQWRLQKKYAAVWNALLAYAMAYLLWREQALLLSVMLALCLLLLWGKSPFIATKVAQKPPHK